MKILKLTLYKYKRLFLNNIDKIEYTPMSNIQVILGRNMSGKSSLLKELSPLPADLKKEYKDGGYKEIHIEHNHSNYILKSVLTNDKPYHSFNKDGNELNQGGTRKVQLDLVKEYFGITPDIQDILLNLNMFTSMSPFERKKWFSLMATLDYTYPISVYNKIKTKYRDIIGGIKLTTDNIVSTESKLNNTELLTKYSKDKEVLEELKEHIAALHTMDGIQSYNQDDISNELVNLTDKLMNLKSQIETDRSIDEISKSILTNKIKIDHVEKDIKKTIEELNLLEKSKEYGEETKLQDELDKTRIELDKLLVDLNSVITTEIDISHLEQDQLDYNQAYKDVISNINVLSEYDDLLKYSKDEIVDLRTKLGVYSNGLIRLNKSTLLIQEELLNLAKNKTEENKIKCDKCGNISYFKYNPKEEHNLKELLVANAKDIKILEPKIQELTVLIERIDRRLEMLNNIKSIIKSYPNLKYIWVSMLSNIDINTSNSETLLTEFNKYLVYLSRWKDITKLNKNVKTLEDKIKFIQDTKKMNISMESNRIELLNNNLHDLNNLHQELINSLKQDQKASRLVNDLRIVYFQLLDKLSNIRVEMKNLEIDIRNRHLSELLFEVKDNIVKIDKELFDIKSSKDRLDKDKSILERYKAQEKVLKILEKELSPTEGLIAKSINSFLNIFVEEMNAVISNIWTYDLELLPCSIDTTEGIDLDYKFKVRVDNHETIEDVSKLSSSSKEIVNLAYRIVFAKYMGLESIPLYLDEFAATMDVTHRANAYNVIDKIISSEYGQIFIICHYSDLYASLRNVDFNILDPNNIDTNYIKHSSSCFKINM